MKTFTKIVATMIVAVTATAQASTYEASECNRLDDKQCLESPECVTIRTSDRWLKLGDKDESLCVEKKLDEGSCYWDMMYEIRDPQNCASMQGCVWIADKGWCVPDKLVSTLERVDAKATTTTGLRGSS